MPDPSTGAPFYVFVVGAVLALCGWLAWIAILSKYDLHSSFKFREGLRRYRSPEAAEDRRRARRRLGVTLLGVLVLFVGIMMGDGSRNAPCRDACKAEGWSNGRFRGSPHETDANGRAAGPTQCWCQREGEWSPDPLEVPLPGE